MSTPKPKPQPNRHQRRAVQRATEPTTMTITAATRHASHTCDQLGVCNSRTPACTADQCRQGRAACPVPQACEVAERPGVAGLDWGHPWAPLEEPPVTAKTIAAGLAVGFCAVAAAVVIVVSLAP